VIEWLSANYEPLKRRALEASRASRGSTGLTEEQARALTRHARALARVARIALRGHGYYGVRTALYGEADALRARARRASRGETGPAAVDPPTPDRPAGLTRAMHDAAQRPSVPAPPPDPPEPADPLAPASVLPKHGGPEQ